MRTFNLKKNSHFCPTINVEKLWSLTDQQTREHYAKSAERIPVIDVTKAGIFKVLGSGQLPNQPVVVKAKFFSRRAEQNVNDS